MESIHRILMKKVPWYNNWHHYQYSDTAHYFIIGVMVAVDLYLIFALKQEFIYAESYYYASL